LTLEIQPTIKRERIWMDHKALFPILEMGFCILDILMKSVICIGCRFWQVKL
jgi:hypothetical protein